MAKKIKVIFGVDDPGLVVSTVESAPETADILIITRQDPDGVIPRFERPGVYVFHNQPAHKMAEMLQGLSWSIATANCQIIRNSEDQYYTDILEIFERELNCFRLNMFTTMNNCDIIQRNVFANIQRFSRCAAVKNLQNTFLKSGVICVAAGPSLDSEIETLRMVQGDFLVIAVDTALKPLAAAGITPDIACALDYSELNLQKLAGLPPACPIVALPAVQPALIDMFMEAGQEVFISYRPDEFYAWMDKNVAIMGSMPFMGCVGVMAFELAAYMGADRIALVGYDFAFPGESSHAKGSMYDGVGPDPNCQLPAIGGGTVLSNEMFAGLLNEFQKRVSETTLHVKDIINTSRVGAMIRDTTFTAGLAEAAGLMKESKYLGCADITIQHAASGKAAPRLLHQVKEDLLYVQNLAVLAQNEPDKAKDVYNWMIEKKNVLELIDLSMVKHSIAIDGGEMPGSEMMNYYQAIESTCKFYREIME